MEVTVNGKYTIVPVFVFFAVLMGTPARSSVQVGDDAPDFELVDTNDQLFKLSDERGNIVVLFFLGYSCGSCLAEAPYLEENIHLPWRDQGVKVVGIEIWNGTKSLIDTYFIGYTGITYPVLMDGDGVALDYGVSNSNYVIIGSDGKVKYITNYYDEKEILSVIGTLTSTPGQRPKVTPRRFVLQQNFPNPFNAGTKIEYEIRTKEPVDVRLTIFDLLGNTIRTFSGVQKSGFYEVFWNGQNDNAEPVPSGVYFYTLKAGDFRATKRMLLIQ